MRNLRTTIGVALVFSLLLVFISGFVATSSRDVLLVIIGYALGLFAVCLNDHLKARRAQEKAGLTRHRE